MILDFFDREPYAEKEITLVRKDGTEITRVELVPCDLPLFEKFAVSIGTHRATLLDWTTKFPDFSDAYKGAKDLQKNILITNAIRGLYNPVFSIFTAKNITDMRDKIEGDVNHTATGALGKYMDALLKVGTNDGTGTGGPGRA